MLISALIPQLQMILDTTGDLYIMAARDAEGNGYNYVMQACVDGYCAMCGDLFNLADPDAAHGCGEDAMVVTLDVDG